MKDPRETSNLLRMSAQGTEGKVQLALLEKQIGVVGRWEAELVEIETDERRSAKAKSDDKVSARQKAEETLARVADDQMQGLRANRMGLEALLNRERPKTSSLDVGERIDRAMLHREIRDEFRAMDRIGLQEVHGRITDPEVLAALENGPPRLWPNGQGGLVVGPWIPAELIANRHRSELLRRYPEEAAQLKTVSEAESDVAFLTNHAIGLMRQVVPPTAKERAEAAGATVTTFGFGTEE